VAWLKQRHWAALEHVSKTRTRVFQRVGGTVLVSAASGPKYVSWGFFGSLLSLPPTPPKGLKAHGSV
jgi:hypothetical protein